MKKLITISLVLIMLVSLTGCNGNTKTLKCSATSTEENRTSTSDLKVKIKDGEVKDMSLTLNVKLPKEELAYKQAMMEQMLQKTNLVYSTNDGIKAIFDMNNSYFKPLGITKNATYGELKQVLELQGYTCQE